MAALVAHDVERKYSGANLAPNATQYEKDLFLQLMLDLKHFDGGKDVQAIGILVSSSVRSRVSWLMANLQAAILVGQRRGDAVSKLFRDVVNTGSSSDDPATLYASIREALTIVFPFVGLPHTVPALMGLAAEAHALKLEPYPNSR